MTFLRLMMCAMVLVACGDDDSVEDQLTSRFRACDLLGPGMVSSSSEPLDAEDKCFLRCVARGSCEELEAALCGDSDVLENRCDVECFDEGEFACADGSSVPLAYQCDGDDDCPDASDEAGCPTFTCDDGEVLLETARCDFFESCADGSDEAGCTNGFACSDGRRIPEDFQCDGDDDCSDGGDEVGCPDIPVFLCDDLGTVPEEYQCDGDDDCADASDEVGCAEFTLMCMPMP